MAKFRLLHGTHFHGGKQYNPGDPVEADSDLCKKFNTPGDLPRFERLPDDAPLTATPTLAPTESVAAPAEDTLDSMTVEELREWAASEEIDVRGAKTKEQLVKAIRAATAGK